MSLTPEIELSPWPMTVSVSSDTHVVVTGLSGNCYVISYKEAAIGLESPTVASELNVEHELPGLFTSFKKLNP